RLPAAAGARRRGATLPARPAGDSRGPLGVAAARHGRQSGGRVSDPGPPRGARAVGSELGLICLMAATPQLQQGLSQRQLMMIAIGGIIGAGFFVGSGVVISKAGPAAFLTYALCGVLIILVMRMLGEMATANPSTGSFAEYARQALGGWAGFSVGWLYWYFWVVVVGFEAIAGGAVLSYWIDAPLWLLSLLLMVLMTATNLFSVASYGEFEFWFAGIKVAAIVAFLGLGSLFVMGVWPRRGIDFSNLTSHGGFFPHGVGTIFTAISVVISAMVGAEV